MRRLARVIFSNDLTGHQRFETLYEGFVIGGDSKQGAPGMVILRRESKILDKFESISTSRQLVTPNGIRETRALKAGDDLSIDFDPDEFDLIKKYFELCPWNTSAARRTAAVFDWFSATPLIDPAEKPVEEEPVT